MRDMAGLQVAVFGQINLVDRVTVQSDTSGGGLIGSYDRGRNGRFFDEIIATLDCGIYSPALLSVMMVPDACGAIEYPVVPSGQGKNRYRYISWYNRYVGGHSGVGNFVFDGEVVWILRNGMLHETALALSRFDFDRVLFTAPNPVIQTHMSISRNNGETTESALSVDLEFFCYTVIEGARLWLKDIENDASKQAALNKLVQFRPSGLAPHIVGVPLVA